MDSARMNTAIMADGAAGAVPKPETHQERPAMGGERVVVTVGSAQ